MIYLISPYTHTDPSVRHRRYQEASHCAAHFKRQGIAIFSPVHYGHTMSVQHDGIPQTHEFWMTICLPILRSADMIYLLPLRGWTKSEGLADELMEAMTLVLPIKTVDPKTYEVRRTSFQDIANEKETEE